MVFCVVYFAFSFLHYASEVDYGKIMAGKNVSEPIKTRHFEYYWKYSANGLWVELKDAQNNFYKHIVLRQLNFYSCPDSNLLINLFVFILIAHCQMRMDLTHLNFKELAFYLLETCNKVNFIIFNLTGNQWRNQQAN